MPAQSVTINNVSMDYFLRGVDAAKPKNAPQVPQEAQAGANAVVAPELEAAGYERAYGYGDSAHAKALKCRDEFFKAMDTLAKAAMDSSKTKKELDALYRDMYAKGSQLYDAAKAAKRLSADSAARINVLFGRFSGIQSVIKGLG